MKRVQAEIRFALARDRFIEARLCGDQDPMGDLGREVELHFAGMLFKGKVDGVLSSEGGTLVNLTLIAEIEG